MNCRPGDLAFIVGLPSGLALNGRPVQLTKEPPFLMFGVLHWRLEVVVETVLRVGGWNTFTGEYMEAGSIGVVHEVPDENLRPIRGNGVTDDEVRELYAPTLEVAHG